jgi:hypothetical protein
MNRESLGYLRVLIDRYDSAVEVDRVDRGSVLGLGDRGHRPYKRPYDGSWNGPVCATDDFHGCFWIAVNLDRRELGEEYPFLAVICELSGGSSTSCAN